VNAPKTGQILTEDSLQINNLQRRTTQDTSAYQDKIPATNAIYAHAQDFSEGDELLLAILKAFVPQPLNKQQTKVFHVF
jgi:hypothetical protein